MERKEIIENYLNSILNSRAEKIELTYKLTYSYEDINNIHAKLYKPLSNDDKNLLKKDLADDLIEEIDIKLDSYRINENRPARADWVKTRFLYNIVDDAKERLKNNITDKNLNDVVTAITEKGEETKYTTTYSELKNTDWNNVSATLKKHLPESFKNKSDLEIAEKVSEIYEELDYLHARWDGNSLTNRTFISMLGEESGFKVKWDKIDRQEMYLSRDKSLADKTMDRNYEARPDAATTMHIIETIEERNNKNYDMKEIIKPQIVTKLKATIDIKKEKQKSHTKEDKEYKKLQQNNKNCRKLR